MTENEHVDIGTNHVRNKYPSILVAIILYSLTLLIVNDVLLMVHAALFMVHAVLLMVHAVL